MMELGHRSGFAVMVTVAVMAAPVGAQDSLRVRQTSSNLEAQVSRLADQLLAQRDVEQELRRVYIELVTKLRNEGNEQARIGREREVRVLYSQLRQSVEQQLRLRRELETVCTAGEKPQGWFGIMLKGDVTVRRQPNGAVVYRYGAHQTVVTVDPGSPADKAGIKSEDLIVAIGGRDLRTGDVIAAEMLRPGTTVPVTLIRSGDRQQVLVDVEARPESFEMACPYLDSRIATAIMPAPPSPPAPDFRVFVFTDSSGARPRIVKQTPRLAPTPAVAAGGFEPSTEPTVVYPSLFSRTIAAGTSVIAGAQIIVMNEDLGHVFGVDEGLLVLKVLAGTPAQRSGLKGGDVLLKANDQRLLSPQSLARLISLSSDDEVKLTILRQKQQQTLLLKW